MTESPTVSAIATSGHTARTVAIQEKLKWYRWTAGSIVGATIWIAMQVVQENQDILDNLVGIFSVELDGRSAALIAIVFLLTCLLCIKMEIYENIGKLGDRGFSQAARVQRVSSTIIALISIASFVFVPDTAIDVIRSGYHIAGIVVVLLLCLIGDILLERANKGIPFRNLFPLVNGRWTPRIGRDGSSLFASSYVSSKSRHRFSPCVPDYILSFIWSASAGSVGKSLQWKMAAMIPVWVWSAIFRFTTALWVARRAGWFRKQRTS